MFRWTGKTWEESIVTCIADFVKNNRHNSGFGALPDCAFIMATYEMEKRFVIKLTLTTKNARLKSGIFITS